MISTDEMKKLEELSQKHGTSKIKLMENAGRGLFNTIKKDYNIDDKKILIICGHGNNGGDGFVLAKYLLMFKFDVDVLFLGDEKKLKKESGYNYFFLKQNFTNHIIYEKDFNQIFNKYDILIDCMLGTGIMGNIREPFSSAIDYMNSTDKITLSVDIPTGLNPDTGEIFDKIVRFDKIYTFHDIKPGLVKYKESVKIIKIGIPKDAIDESSKEVQNE